MSQFIDGPAAGVSLSIRRAPIFLRVTRNPAGEWDALDQLTDTARDDELLFAYVLTDMPLRYHLCVRGKRRGASGWYEDGKYEFIAAQPSDEEMRSGWRDWCLTHRRLAPLNIQQVIADQEAK